MAVISLDFSSVATWPRAIPSSLAQALTMCSGPSPWAASWERRHVLPSMAISRSGTAARRCRNCVGDPVLEALLKGLGLERHQQPTNAVARGNAVGKRQELLQPIQAIGGPAMDGRRTIAATHHAAHGDHHDIDQQMFAIPGMPGVGERLEVGTDGFDVHPFGCHATHPGMRQAARRAILDRTTVRAPP